jgi:hypothetical protein
MLYPLSYGGDEREGVRKDNFAACGVQIKPGIGSP